MNQFLEAARMLELPNDGIRIVASFDEFNLDVEFRYEGALMEVQVSARLRPKFSRRSDVARLTGFLIKNYADGIRTDCQYGKVSSFTSIIGHFTFRLMTGDPFATCHRSHNP
jgi:hypothetical protein